MFNRQLWLVRHGNRLDFVQPSWFSSAAYPYDPPLCSIGHQQARELAMHLAAQPIHHLFTSPFLRARQTAECCAHQLGLPLKIDVGLGEWHNPRWMSRVPSLCLAQSQQCQRRRHWINSRQDTPPYPEDAQQLQQRSTRAIYRLLSGFSGNLLVIGHQVPLSMAIAALLGHQSTINLGVCAVNRLIYLGDRWIWLEQNETGFLSDPGVKVAVF